MERKLSLAKVLYPSTVVAALTFAAVNTSPAYALTDQFDPGKNAFECMGNCLKANPIARQLGEAAQYCSQKCEEHLKQLAAKGELQPLPTPHPKASEPQPQSH